MASPPNQHEKRGEFVQEKLWPGDSQLYASKVNAVSTQNPPHEKRGEFVEEKRLPGDSQLYASKVNAVSTQNPPHEKRGEFVEEKHFVHDPKCYANRVNAVSTQHGQFVEKKDRLWYGDTKLYASKVDEVANKKNQHAKDGKFVKDKHCPCPDDSQLYAIKVNKVVCGEVPSIAGSCVISAIFVIWPLLLAVAIDSYAVYAFLFTDRKSASNRFKDASLLCLIIGVPLTIYVLLRFCCAFIVSRTMMTHTALEVLYKCNKCDYEAHKTYEILDTKFMEWGRYTKLSKPPERFSVSVTDYGDIERTFRGIRKETGCCEGSNKWTNDLIKRLGGQSAGLALDSVAIVDV